MKTLTLNKEQEEIIKTALVLYCGIMSKHYPRLEEEFSELIRQLNKQNENIMETTKQ